MNCPKCGALLSQNAKFCGKCGTVINAAPGAQLAPKPWFLFFGGQNQGPYSQQEVIAIIKSGKANMETNAWKQGMDGWTKLGSIREFSSAQFSAEPSPQPVRQKQPAAPRTKKAAAPQPSQTAKKASKPDSAQTSAEDIQSTAPKIDTSVAGKYRRMRQKREAAEARNAAQKMRRDTVEQSASLKVMKTRDGVPIQIYESPLLVLPLLIAAPPLLHILLKQNIGTAAVVAVGVVASAGLILMWHSRKFGGGGKFLLTILFAAAMGITSYFGFNPAMAPGAELNIRELPEGINKITYDAIHVGMRVEYLYHMMGDTIEPCTVENTFAGEMNLCKWEDAKTGETIQIKTRKGLVAWKQYKAADETAEPEPAPTE